jgi:hypothetical protein
MDHPDKPGDDGVEAKGPITANQGETSNPYNFTQ